MAVEICPVCRAPMPVALDQINKYAQVSYYRCASCGHVWTTPKDGDVQRSRDVTPRAPAPKTRMESQSFLK